MSIKVFKCYNYDYQKIDAEARVLKLEKEYGNAKNVVFQLKQFPMKSVGDIKRVSFLNPIWDGVENIH